MHSDQNSLAKTPPQPAAKNRSYASFADVLSVSPQHCAKTPKQYRSVSSDRLFKTRAHSISARLFGDRIRGFRDEMFHKSWVGLCETLDQSSVQRYYWL